MVGLVLAAVAKEEVVALDPRGVGAVGAAAVVLGHGGHGNKYGLNRGGEGATGGGGGRREAGDGDARRKANYAL